MAIDLNDIFRRGGSPLIEFLQYCVVAVRMEPIFAYLIQDYRNHPTAPGARALYEMFCAADAPARILAAAVLPPRDLRLPRSMEPFHTPPAKPDGPTCELLPPKHIFDFVVTHLVEEADGRLQRSAAEFDPTRTAIENLPGGKMNAGQRAFVENIWRPSVRPRLSAAGFWRIATIGG